MPYFVYAIHLTSPLNRLYQDKPINDFQEARTLETEMQRGTNPNDNYFVELINAENEAGALKSIK